jgi:hypothetical protein
MKCLYYIAPTLKSTHTISDDLHEIGVNDWYMHVVSKDIAGLRRKKIHSSNFMGTLDILRTGTIGASIGFFVGMLGAIALIANGAFGANAPLWTYTVVILPATMFGGWFGGLLGAGTENHKLNEFHDDIANGQYLFLIYAKKRQLDTIYTMMLRKHPESVHVATDEHFLNPLGDVHRTPHTN